MSAMDHKVLVLGAGGAPKEWVRVKEAIIHYAKDHVAWELGDTGKATFTGGTNRITGNLSTITAAPIIALHNAAAGLVQMRTIPALTNTNLFRRDCWQCAYCGNDFPEHLLTRDHIHPVSRGGLDKWENVISSCKRCNNMKDDALLEDLHWDMHIKPYVPNHVEWLFYDNLNIKQVQIDYLVNFLNPASRVWQLIEKLKGRHEEETTTASGEVFT